MASTGEFAEDLHDLIERYLKRCTPAEIMGILQFKAIDIHAMVHDQEDDDGDDGEEWKRA